MSLPGVIIFRPEVRGDVAELAAHFDQSGRVSSDQFIDIVFSTLRDLAAMPGQGSLKLYRSRRLAGIRSWSVRGYRKILILYRPLTDGIEVIAIAHGARDLKKLLARRLQNP